MDKKTLKHLLNILRKGTTTWHGRRDCLLRVRKSFDEGFRTKSGKVKYKLHWQCEKCRKWFRDQSDLEVDHIIEVGPFNGNFDDYIKRLYCEQSNLQALCISCHSIKTAGYSAHLRFSRKKV